MADKTTEHRVPALRPQSMVLEAGDGKLHVVMEMPGVSQQNLDVRIDGNELRVVGRRQQPQDARYLLRERRPGDYLQAWTLDETIDQNRVDAVLRQGILTLTLDLKDQVKPRTVKIRSE